MQPSRTTERIQILCERLEIELAFADLNDGPTIRPLIHLVELLNAKLILLKLEES